MGTTSSLIPPPEASELATAKRDTTAKLMGGREGHAHTKEPTTRSSLVRAHDWA